MRRLMVLAMTLAVVGATMVSLPAEGARTPTHAPTCGNSLARTTATNKTMYARGTPVKVSTSLVNTSRRTCAVDVRACVSATITNARGTIVWSAVPFNAACAQYIVRQVLAPGQAVTRSWTWDQHVCTLIGKCPGPQVGPGTYVAQGHWGTPSGDARPTSFTISA